MRPILIYDGRCSFCKIWIEYWRQLTAGAIDFAPSQEISAQYPQIPPGTFRKSVVLVLPDGEYFTGAQAVFRSLNRMWAYDHIPGFAPASELGYRIIAANRNFFYWVTVLLFGRSVEPLTYHRVEFLFARVLALIWIVAFASYGVQADGLIGSRGILPANFSDTTLHAIWIGGVVCGVLALFGKFQRLAFAVAFVLYLKLVNSSQEFLSYQWDILLLETGFLAIFLGYSRLVVWLFRWLLFRLMFLSGAVKLLSGDQTWRNLTALAYHFQTQPIPTPLAWYAHQLPLWFQKASCFATLAIELGAAFLVLGPRRVRLFAASFLIGLQLLIMLTGNYAFFNWLALALCLFLFDDRHMPFGKAKPVSKQRPVVAWVLAAVLVPLSSMYAAYTLFGDLPAPARSIVAFTSPLGITSSYGLFAVMTTRRLEIVVEGSNDGETWAEYEFRYKPGDLRRAPPLVAPHQPRLDWQMWFAALGSYRENVWFLRFVMRLLENSPDVVGLVGKNPFPSAAPRFIRARMYEYRFSNTPGQWWDRTDAGLYIPPLTVDDLHRALR